MDTFMVEMVQVANTCLCVKCEQWVWVCESVMDSKFGGEVYSGMSNCWKKARNILYPYSVQWSEFSLKKTVLFSTQYSGNYLLGNKQLRESLGIIVLPSCSMTVGNHTHTEYMFSCSSVCRFKNMGNGLESSTVCVFCRCVVCVSL